MLKFWKHFYIKKSILKKMTLKISFLGIITQSNEIKLKNVMN